MPKYVLRQINADSVEELAEALREALLDMQIATEFAEDLILPYLHVAPDKTEPGMIVNADGTDWNPGSGAGTYRRNEANSAWVFLG